MVHGVVQLLTQYLYLIVAAFSKTSCVLFWTVSASVSTWSQTWRSSTYSVWWPASCSVLPSRSAWRKTLTASRVRKSSLLVSSTSCFLRWFHHVCLSPRSHNILRAVVWSSWRLDTSISLKTGLLKAERFMWLWSLFIIMEGLGAKRNLFIYKESCTPGSINITV